MSDGVRRAGAIVASLGLLAAGAGVASAVAGGPSGEAVLASGVRGRAVSELAGPQPFAAGALPEPTVPSATTIPVAPVTTTTAPARTTTTAATTATPVPPPPVTTAPTTTPPAPNPSSWRVTENGITVEARIEPAAPKVGDAVRITYSASGAGDFCCWLFLYVNGTSLGVTPESTGGCPLPQSTTATYTYRATSSGWVNFQVQGNLATKLCIGPPGPILPANLYGSFAVA